MLKLKPKNVIVFVIITALLSTGCHPVFCVWELGYSDIDANDTMQVAGTYKLTMHSKKMMKYEGGYNNTPDSYLILLKDKTYQLKNAPDWIADRLGKSSKHFINQTGSWNLLHYSNKHMFDMGDLISSDLSKNKDGKLCVLITIGDGDNCQGMVYEKQ